MVWGKVNGLPMVSEAKKNGLNNWCETKLIDNRWWDTNLMDLQLCEIVNRLSPLFNKVNA